MAGLAVGAARQRRERQLCSFLRHEELSVKMALARALHHRAREERRPTGTGASTLGEAPWCDGARGSGGGSHCRSRGWPRGLSSPHRCWRTLAADTADARTVKFLFQAALELKKKEEEEKERERKRRKEFANETIELCSLFAVPHEQNDRIALVGQEEEEEEEEKETSSHSSSSSRSSTSL